LGHRSLSAQWFRAVALELLKPPAERVASFKIGSAYDLDHVGLAREQTQFGAFVLWTTADCGAGKMDGSGNSRCGHDYGTWLTDDERRPCWNI